MAIFDFWVISQYLWLSSFPCQQKGKSDSMVESKRTIAKELSSPIFTDNTIISSIKYRRIGTNIFDKHKLECWRFITAEGKDRRGLLLTFKNTTAYFWKSQMSYKLPFPISSLKLQHAQPLWGFWGVIMFKPQITSSMVRVFLVLVWFSDSGPTDCPHTPLFTNQLIWKAL